MFERLRAWFFPAFLLSVPGAVLAGEALIIPLWPNRPPVVGASEEKVVERSKDAKPNRSISNVSVPTLTLYLPPEETATGAAVIICPGGGYGALAIDKEGHDVARWLNTVGVAGIVLKYRLPRHDLSKDEKPFPLQDVQQAFRLVRSRASEWKINPQRLGVMGFSAGGHLASTCATHFDAGKPDAADAIDRLGCRPDFTILIYPVVSMKDPVGHPGSRGALLGKSPTPEMIELYSNELQVTAQTPPTFLAHAKDDGVKVENSIQFAEALKKAGVPYSLNVFEKGGHGFGLGINGGEPATWPQHCADWLKTQDFLSKK